MRGAKINYFLAYLPFWSAGRLDDGRHAISVQALGLGEVDHVENDSLQEEDKKKKTLERH